MLTDTHAHLDDPRFEGEVHEVIKRAKDAGIDFILNPGCNMATSAKAIKLSETFDIVYAAVGIHPSDCMDYRGDADLEQLTAWCALPKTLAIGEIGLDYYYDDGAPRDVQKEVFEAQMDLANRLGLPVVIHDRDAHQDSLDMVRACLKPDAGGVFHCFSGSVEMARQLLDLGLYIGIDGPLTFKNSRKAPDVVAYVPKDRLLIETDSPYLTPVPFRGQRNEPAYVAYVAAKVAQIWEMSPEAVWEQTAANAKRLFGGRTGL